MEIKIGTSHTEAVAVDGDNIASSVGSGAVDVYATPAMVALLELAAARCLEPFLDEGLSSVGVRVDVGHSAATPIGMKVTATATVAAVDRRRVEFDIVVTDEAGEVGRGRHTRVVVDRERFMEKAVCRGIGIKK